MKKIRLCYLLLAVLFIGQIYAQGPTGEWAHSFGGSQRDVGKCVQETVDGGYIVAGYSNSNDGDLYSGHKGGYDAIVIKYSSSGVVQWRKNLGGSSDDKAHSIYQTNDGGYIIACSTGSNDGDVTGNNGWIDFWIVKLSNSGNIQWQTALGGSGADIPEDIKQTNYGGYIVTGTTWSSNGDVTGNHGKSDCWVVSLNSSGNLLWQKTYGGSENEGGRSIQLTPGGYIIAGYAASTDGDVTQNKGGIDYWVLKISLLGTLSWQKTYGGNSTDMAEEIKTTLDGGFIVAGVSSSSNGDVTGNHGFSDCWIVKLNAQGSLIWKNALGGSRWESSKDIVQISNGNFVIAGYSNSLDGDVKENIRDGSNDYWIVELSSDGSDIHWQASYGGSSTPVSEGDRAESIQLTSDGGLIITGHGDLGPGNHGMLDAWTIKLKPHHSASQLAGEQCGELVHLFDPIPPPSPTNPSPPVGVLPYEDHFFFAPVFNAEDYRMTVINNGGPFYFKTSTSGGPNFILKSNFTGVQYNRIYNVKVQAKVNGVWLPFGPTCLISTDPNALWKETRGASSNVNPLLDIYPNPSNNGGFRINLTNLKDENNQITILVYDMFGKQVYTNQFTHDRSDFTTRLNTDGSLSSGIYLVNVSVNGKTFNQKVKVE